MIIDNRCRGSCENAKGGKKGKGERTTKGEKEGERDRWKKTDQSNAADGQN